MMLSIGFLLQSCEAPNKNGAATPDRIVEQYLTALEAKNESLMRRSILPERQVKTKEIEAKLTKFGGYKIQDRQIEYIKSKPILWTANIRGAYLDRDGIKKKFDDSIEIEYQSKGQVKLYGGRWYLLLGNSGE
jgi:hypothetical protein